MVSLVGRFTEEKIEQQTKNRKLNYKYNWKNAYRFWRDKMQCRLVKKNHFDKSCFF